MIHSILTYIGILVYLLMAICFFREWLDFYLADKDMNSNERFFSGIVLVLGSFLWIVFVPLAYLELLKFHKKNKKIIEFMMDNNSIYEK
ncbi:hypothetical protein BC008_12385 [Mastigocoleus testarum BC008]|uniref:Uncharacterized protein n=1 Tax=Mastigocoleus testarum BC008 TaxID=371196 RepID=A0A0V7ZCV4_9CYAN|nr:hypothetical protein BC008_09370 [Mastigocoleus testarum BC008]KST63102.1 hypothetical protein BC008_12385 [Mastigocoleus testarum BC008]